MTQEEQANLKKAKPIKIVSGLTMLAGVVIVAAGEPVGGVFLLIGFVGFVAGRFAES